MCYLLFIALLGLATSCKQSDEKQISDLSYSFFDAVSKKDTQQLLELVYPPIVKHIGKTEVTNMFIDTYSKRYKVKKFEGIVSQITIDNKTFFLASTLAKAGRPIGKTRIFTFMYVKDENGDFFIIPYAADTRFRIPYTIVQEGIIPKEVIDHFSEDYPLDIEESADEELYN